jgi:FkbM family methyltransferase
LHKVFHLPLKGLGRLQKLITEDRILHFNGKKLYYSAKVNGSYDLLLIGKSNEPETHILFDRIIPRIEGTCNFIDVGASVGEFISSISNYDNVGQIIGFEPRRDCFEAIVKTNELNGENRVVVYNSAVGSEKGKVLFDSRQSGSGSGILRYRDEGETVEEVDQIKLDDVLPETLDNTIMLIDVEGYELEVLKGAAAFIRENQPLIVFEYNEVSRKYFTVSEISSVLGNTYSVYKVTSDGELDADIHDTWNCLAVSSASPYQNIVNDLIV